MMKFKAEKKFVALMLLVLVTALLSACAMHKEKNMAAEAPNPAHLHAAQYYKAQYEQNQSDLAALLGLSRNLRYSGQSRMALDYLSAGESRFSQHAAYWTEKGKVLLALGYTRPAKKTLQQSLTMPGAETNWDGWSALGVSYDFLHSYDDAAQAYRQAASICPASASILNNQALSTALDGDIVAARAMLVQAATLQPFSTRIKNNLELINQRALHCAQCSRDELAKKARSAIAGPDWAGGELACQLSGDEIVDALNNRDYIDMKVEFAFDSAVLTLEAMATLDRLGRALRTESLRADHFVLEGHADAVGTQQYNQGLSERRAQAVKTYLVNTTGIDSRRLTAKGYGETRLLDPEHPTSGVNRRVRIIRIK